jgi:hypothetical protein
LISKIESVISITTVPLLEQTRRVDENGVSHFKQLNDPEVDIELVKEEFNNRVLYIHPIL